jgi:hypothetical protein
VYFWAQIDRESVFPVILRGICDVWRTLESDTFVTLDGIPGTRAPGHRSPGPRAFFYLILFFILAGVLFFSQKIKKNIVFSLFFLSFSLSFSLSLYTHFGFF